MGVGNRYIIGPSQIKASSNLELPNKSKREATGITLPWTPR